MSEIENNQGPHVPKEIMDAAYKIDRWAKLQGWEDYAIGPIRNRFSKSAFDELEEIKQRVEKIESFLVL